MGVARAAHARLHYHQQQEGKGLPMTKEMKTKLAKEKVGERGSG